MEGNYTMQVDPTGAACTTQQHAYLLHKRSTTPGLGSGMTGTATRILGRGRRWSFCRCRCRRCRRGRVTLHRISPHLRLVDASCWRLLLDIGLRRLLHGSR